MKAEHDNDDAERARKEVIWDIQRRHKQALDAKRRAKANTEEADLAAAVQADKQAQPEQKSTTPDIIYSNKGSKRFWRERISTKPAPEDDGLHRHKRMVQRTLMQERTTKTVLERHPGTAVTLPRDDETTENVRHPMIRFAALLLVPGFGALLLWLSRHPDMLDKFFPKNDASDYATMAWVLMIGGSLVGSSVSLAPMLFLLTYAFTGEMLNYYLHWAIPSHQSWLCVLGAVGCLWIFGYVKGRKDRFDGFLEQIRADIANRKDADGWTNEQRERETQRLANKMMDDHDERERDKSEIARLRASRRHW